jgi:hypothetical protein
VPIQKPRVNIKNFNQPGVRLSKTPVIVKAAQLEIMSAIAIIGDLFP